MSRCSLVVIRPNGTILPSAASDSHDCDIWNARETISIPAVYGCKWGGWHRSANTTSGGVRTSYFWDEIRLYPGEPLILVDAAEVNWPAMVMSVGNLSPKEVRGSNPTCVCRSARYHAWPIGTLSGVLSHFKFQGHGHQFPSSPSV